VGTGDREVPRNIVAVDNEVPYLPVPVRKCGEQRRELRRNGGSIHRDVVDPHGRFMRISARTDWPHCTKALLKSRAVTLIDFKGTLHRTLTG
jgi:hypothetical protein